MAIPGSNVGSANVKGEVGEHHDATQTTGAMGNDSKPSNASEERASRKPHRLTIPGFISEEVGLGDLIKRVTATVGIRPCGGCLRRAQALNSWMAFTPRSRR
jgi:hypothetical protein